MSPEAMDGLLAVMHGDPYMKARRGATRAGRTRTLGSLFRRGLIESIGIEIWSLTDAGRKALPDSAADQRG